MELSPALYLIPVNLSDASLNMVLPDEVMQIAVSLKHYIVENVRTARRFLKRCDKSIDINEITFHELNQHTNPKEISGYLEALRRGEAVGVMSEAGCPAIADPGSVVVKMAQEEGFKVRPLVGPSSILLSLMASGFNGQGFSFHGYLPVNNGLEKKIKQLETAAYKDDMTQIFIETPYRNNKMLETLTKTLRSETKICVASLITDLKRESISVKSAKEWGKSNYDYNKTPTIFLIYHP